MALKDEKFTKISTQHPSEDMDKNQKRVEKEALENKKDEQRRIDTEKLIEDRKNKK